MFYIVKLIITKGAYLNNMDYFLSKSIIDVIVQGEGEIDLTDYLKNADDKSFTEPIINISIL